MSVHVSSAKGEVKRTKLEVKSSTVKVLRLVRGNEPVGHIAFTTDKKGNVSATVAAKSPKDVWNKALGRQVVLGRFSVEEDRMHFTIKNDKSFEEAKRGILSHLVTSKHPQVCDKVRRAAKSMLKDLSGDDIRTALTRFLVGNPGKLSKKKALVQSILDQVQVGPGAPSVKRETR